MSTLSTYDVFLSYSHKDGVHVRSLAERLQSDGLRVWLDDWEIRGDNRVSRKINDGLERSKVLLICLSEHSATSTWRQLETQTFIWRNRSGEGRTVYVLRLDDVVIGEPWRQFKLIDWRPFARTEESPKLL